MDLDISKLHFNARPKIYIASSWKNAGLVRTLSLVMQGLGHEVYDFTDAEKHFAFDAADIERFAGKRDEIDWLDFMECTETLKAFQADRAGINWADAVLMVLPCGRSAHLEAGYAVGRNKPLIIYGDLPKGEFETMYGFANICIRRTDDLADDCATLSRCFSMAYLKNIWGISPKFTDSIRSDDLNEPNGHSEPAPTKDWKPFCFDEYTPADDDFCPGVHQTNWMGYIQPELEENCIECPHRLKEEFK